jgi:hypothetical protein
MAEHGASGASARRWFGLPAPGLGLRAAVFGAPRTARE